MSENVDEMKIFKSLSSPSRIAILRSLENQPMNYTELMRVAGMDKRTGSGKFAHHLKTLFAAGLVRVNEESKLYELTPKGVQIVGILKEMRWTLSETQRIKVRRSNLVLEEFDRNRISKVLVEEAGMPAKTADKVAKAVEERLQNLRIEHLTAPLIREFVNAFLLEQGMEQYRNRLTRLGLPIADVDRILEETVKNPSFSALTSSVAATVFREYALNKIVPSEAAEKYFLGDIDLEGLETWVFSVYSRIYEGDELKSVVKEVEAIEFEVVLKDAVLSEERFGFVADCLVEKSRKVSVYLSESVDADSLSIRRFHLLAPFDKIQLPSVKEVDLVFARRPASSEGHPFEESSAICGKGSVNLVGLFLRSGSSEKKFWDGLRSSLEALNAAFQGKAVSVKRFWRLENFRFVVSLVGVDELVEKAGFDRAEIIAETAKECRRLSEENLLLLASKSSQRAAERLKKLDMHVHGAKEVERLAENKPYSSNPSLTTASEIREIHKFYTGGLYAKVSSKEAEKLKDLKPLVVLSF
ncbi:MAG: helix-turn-helix domain-containing protein [Candidatus Caldarchaeum sp.]|nr:helix-turn-helix domain-containing protein [Candidatus Caldarchaeum sp.]